MRPDLAIAGSGRFLRIEGGLLDRVLAGLVVFLPLADSGIGASVVLYTSMTTGKIMGRLFVCS
jgi:hypothetical protein